MCFLEHKNEILKDIEKAIGWDEVRGSILASGDKGMYRMIERASAELASLMASVRCGEDG